MPIARKRFIDSKILWSIYNSEKGCWMLDNSTLINVFETESDCICAINMYVNNGLLKGVRIEKIQN